MKPIDFKGRNFLIAEHQDEYLTLPAYVDSNGGVLSCWSMSFKERVKALFIGKMWLTVIAGNGPVQPQLMSVHNPMEKKDAN